MRCLSAALLAFVLTWSLAATATAQTETPPPTPNPMEVAQPESSAVPTDGEPAPGPGGATSGQIAADTVLSALRADVEIPVDTPLVAPVVPKVAAARESRVLLSGDVLCADGSSSSSSYLAPVRNDELAGLEAAAEAERRERDGASGAEILAAINGNSDAGSGGWSAKALKRPVLRRPLVVVALQDPVDIEAVFELFAQIAEAVRTGSPIVDDGECDVPYVCGGERIDDVVSGRIDSESSGVYAEYVTGVAVELDELTAGIRAAETNAPGGVLVDIPVPSSEQGVLSLMDALAQQGLGEAPGELYLPEFNYCRIGDAGPIETDPGVDEVVLPSFTWTLVSDEFDIDGTSRSVLAAIEAQLLGRLPDMRAIPPMDTGVTIVQFPMWLWLDDPLTFVEAGGTSDSGHIRVRGRAFLDHVTWTLGEHELVCLLDEMVAYVPDSGMDVADKPDCHHIFTQLEEYTVTAAATYRIEQQVSVQLVAGLPFPDTAWTPHPVNEFVTVDNTSGQMRVEEIYSINVPLDYQSAD